MNNNTHIVIMAGGIGSRFWPISTPEYPKQFIDILGVGKTLIQLTVERFQLPGNFGWSDLGSWGSVQTHVATDTDGNAVVGNNISLYECKDCIVSASNAAKIVVQGLNGYIVAEKEGRILICSLKEEQRIKEFSK